MLNCVGCKEIICSGLSFKTRLLSEGHIGQVRVESKPSVQRLNIKPVEPELGPWNQKLIGIEG